MQENMKRNILYSLTGMLIFVLAACTDDWFNNRYEQMPEGETNVNATVEFFPLRPALDVKTRTAGDAIKDINNLCVLLYDKEGNLTKTYYLLPEGSASTEGNNGSFSIKNEDRTNADAEGGPTAESWTKQASFRLSGVPYGNHYIYAVANMGNLENRFYPAIKTREGLKSIGLEWQAENWVSTEGNGDDAKTKAIANNQMFGYFTTQQNAPTGANRNTEDTPVTINKKDMTLHAWIRRAASKVTVAYDASGLKEGVFIYLKSVQIKDIPTHCYLGKDNKVGAEDEGYDLPFPAKGEDMPDGEVIKYYEGDTEPTAFDASYPVRLSTGKPYYPWPVEENGVLHKKGHEETADALFFFENMQGKGPSKLQAADGNGELDHPGLPGDDYKYPDYLPKDDVPYGTYIEVDAYYVSVNPEKVGSGNIKYRFMLGKNKTDDYNAERNHHYKLTLKFRNFANDADWHIEYEEPEPGIELPSPYYISYLYNHSMMLPLKIRTGGLKLGKIEASIKDNRWGPHNALSTFDYYKKMDIPYENQWNGFLSLRATKDLVITGTSPYTATSNQSYYEEHKRGERTYPIEEKNAITDEEEHSFYGEEGEKDDGEYKVRKEGDSIYHVQLPMYTRAKQMIKPTGYTGNNPYVAYQRRSEVEIKATLLRPDGTVWGTISTNSSANSAKGNENPVIYQVRRVVNPKGIWRSHSNNEGFNVLLKRLPRENGTKFEAFASEGPWKAYVVCGDKSFINLGVGKEHSEVSNDTVYGKTGSNIDFKIDFKGNCGENENRYAIIRVEYHNYTCYHLIFVRQGDAPDALIDGGTEWHARNMKTKDTETASPLEEGSLFKWGNLTEPIDAINNKNPGPYWINVTPESFKGPGTQKLTIAGTSEEKAWGEIKPVNAPSDDKSGFNATFVDSSQLPSKTRIASYDDFKALYDHTDIKQGYGILYGDESTSTEDDINDAYGYDYNHTKRGMRGCFVYNQQTGKNLFFPIGASGYGHRKENDAKGAGTLRYAASRAERFPEGAVGTAYPNGVAGAPLFYDVYMRPGAIYWLSNYVYVTEPGDGPTTGWDFNYFTFDFYPITRSATGGAKDACFIRCVEDK